MVMQMLSQLLLGGGPPNGTSSGQQGQAGGSQGGAIPQQSEREGSDLNHLKNAERY
ncbi:hypothetical protein ANCCEY_11403 [Ancylostoma ceylanicum]|uniref:Uncharacterized protein n=1 Tax=Ancylostoma ceylanicum TaxID=53326 RepID=A0A0D6LPD3_9BILA|nr:hypothetical protein ANCCEY_11403 [Ancylostoma ceylanicum]